MIELKDNYQDDVLDSEKNQLRKYNMIHNDDGTVSFVDATVYSQNGDNFGAKDVNDIVARIGEVSKAENIDYDGEKSVQGAIDEVKGTIGYSKKNLIPYPYDALVTENGMVFTDLGDGRIEVNGSNPNGTSSCYLHYANNKYKPNFNNQKVTLSLKSVSGQASVFFRLWGEGGTYIKEYDFAIDRKNGSLTIDMPNETDYSYATIELFYYQGSTVTNDIVEIMIRYASIEDDTYEPYVPSVNEAQVITLKTGLSLIIQGKLAILKCEGYSYTHNETIISDDKYKPNGQIYRNMMRAYTSDAKYYDGLVSVKNDGTITMSYLSSQGTGPSTNNVASGQLYGELIYLIK